MKNIEERIERLAQLKESGADISADTIRGLLNDTDVPEIDFDARFLINKRPAKWISMDADGYLRFHFTDEKPKLLDQTMFSSDGSIFVNRNAQHIPGLYEELGFDQTGWRNSLRKIKQPETVWMSLPKSGAWPECGEMLARKVQIYCYERQFYLIPVQDDESE